MSFIFRAAGRVALLLLVILAGIAPTLAAPRIQAGPYTLVLRADPPVIPVGAADLYITVTDAASQPASGLTMRVLARMPDMAMGEREETARPTATPGEYRVSARFGMAGAYEIAFTVKGPAGEGKATIPASTGAPLSGGSSIPWRWLALAAIAIAAGFALHRTRHRVPSSAVVALALVAVTLAGAWLAVKTLRRPGAMTPIEAQVMEMNVPAPPGVVPVELGEVERGTVAQTVTYSGQAVAWIEQDVTPRVQGTILEMPVYTGSRVRKGQVVARLDVSQVGPQAAQQQANVAMSELQVRAAAAEASQAQADVRLAESEVGMKTGEIEEARAKAEAARTEVEGARAELGGALADQRYWREELKRSQQLVSEGAYSTEEHQRTVSQAAMADAKARQADAGLRRSRAEVAAAEAAERKALNDLHSHHAHEDQTRAAYQASVARVDAARAAARQASAAYQAAEAQLGYAEIRAEADGVVTQRVISPGTLVSPGQVLLRIAQTRPARLQANVAVSDLARVKVGAPARVWPQDASHRAVDARVTSVQPAVDPLARTGIVEVVVPNADGRFVPGGYLTMAFPVSEAVNALTAPEGALREQPQEKGGAPRFTLWVAEPLESKRYRVRAVEAEKLAGDGKRVAVKASIEPGMKVVVSGGEYLREGDEVQDVTVVALKDELPSAVTVSVTEKGFEPDVVEVKKGVPVRITFIRKTDKTCATDVVFPEFGITRNLPMNEPVVIEITPQKSGAVVFACGMSMIRGSVVAR